MQFVLVVCGCRKRITETPLNKAQVMKSFTSPSYSVRSFTGCVVVAGAVLFAMQFPAPAVAQARSPSATLLFGPASGSAALTSLILSPAQRRALEAVRNNPGKAEEGVLVLPGTSGEASSGLPDTLVVTGMVVRSGNRSTVWVNDEPLYGQATSTPLRTLAGQAGVLVSGSKDLQIKAKPGQVIDVPSGRALDMLPPGAIRINPAKMNAAGPMKKE